MTRTPCIAVLSLFLLLPACQMQPGIDRTPMESIKGPKIDSVEGTMLQSAEQAEKAGDYPRAGTFYAQLADKYGSKTEYKVSQADAYRRAGQIDAAEKAFDAILVKEPNNVGALEGKMLCRLGKGEQAEAGQLIQQVMAIDPTRWRTLNAAGILFATRNMVDEAMAYYERALSVNKDNTSVLNNVGLTLAMDKQYEKAIQALQRASGLAASGSTTKQQLDMNLAMVYGISGNMELAEKVASQYVTGPALYNNLGYYAKLSKNDAAARDYFNMALAKSPTYYNRAWENLASVNGSKDEARSNNVKVKAGTPIRQAIQPTAKASTAAETEKTLENEPPEEAEPKAGKDKRN